jgi:hypothetical protein
MYINYIVFRVCVCVDPWLPEDINQGKAEYLFFVLGGLMMLNFLVYLAVARAYTYRPPPLDLEPTASGTTKGDIRTPTLDIDPDLAKWENGAYYHDIIVDDHNDYNDDIIDTKM